jgi:hypothetical protein
LALIPLVDLTHLTALLGIAPYDPAGANDLAVLRDLLARRTALAAQSRNEDAFDRVPSARTTCTSCVISIPCQARRVARQPVGMDQGGAAAEADEIDDEAVARLVVMNGYGEVMLRFQLLEMSYWSILAETKLKRGISLDQAMGNVAGWESQTGGRLLNVLGLPADLEDDARTAVNTRNYLAHGFLRDRAIALQDAAGCEETAKELAVVSGKLDEFEERLEAYMRGLGFPELSEEELADLGLGGSQDLGLFADDE